MGTNDETDIYSKYKNHPELIPIFKKYKDISPKEANYIKEKYPQYYSDYKIANRINPNKTDFDKHRTDLKVAGTYSMKEEKEEGARVLGTMAGILAEPYVTSGIRKGASRGIEAVINSLNSNTISSVKGITPEKYYNLQLSDNPKFKYLSQKSILNSYGSILDINKMKTSNSFVTPERYFSVKYNNKFANEVGKKISNRGTSTPPFSYAQNLEEQLAIKEAMSNPEIGKRLNNIELKDFRWPSSEGWEKFEYTHSNILENKIVNTNKMDKPVGGLKFKQKNIKVHFVGKIENGKIIEIDDFKIKSRDVKILDEGKIKRK